MNTFSLFRLQEQLKSKLKTINTNAIPTTLKVTSKNIFGRYVRICDQYGNAHEYELETWEVSVSCEHPDLISALIDKTKEYLADKLGRNSPQNMTLHSLTTEGWVFIEDEYGHIIHNDRVSLVLYGKLLPNEKKRTTNRSNGKKMDDFC